MSKKIKVFTVILSHEHGEVVSTRKSHKKALKVAGKMIEETLKELEDKIDGDEAGIGALSDLKWNLKGRQFEAAIVLYNKLHEDYVSPADMHYLRIKRSTLK